MNRSWHDYFLQMCDQVATRSKDTSTKVGCVIVGPDREIRSTGYNGFPRGARDKVNTATILAGENEIAARYERPLKYKWTEHGERNAIYNSARHGVSLKGCELYVASNPSFPPCTDCSRAIIQSGITAVHLRPCNDIPDRWKEDCNISLGMLQECGVDVQYHDAPFIIDVRSSDFKIDTVPSSVVHNYLTNKIENKPHTRLKELRKEKQMTQIQLAYASGVSHAYVGQLESGFLKPAYKIADKLAKTLGCSVEDLYPGEELKDLRRRLK